MSAEGGDQLLAGLLTTSARLRADPAELEASGPDQPWDLIRDTLLGEQ